MINKENLITNKFFIPNKLTKAPFGTIYNVLTDKKNTYYIQASSLPDVYVWITYADFLEKVFLDKINNKAFIEECLKKLAT